MKPQPMEKQYNHQWNARTTRVIRRSVFGILSIGILLVAGQSPLFAAQDSRGAAQPIKKDAQLDQKAPLNKSIQPRRRPRPTAQIPQHDPSAEVDLGDGLSIVDKSPGDGEQLQNGDIAIILYSGWIKETGSLFGTNRRAKQNRLVTPVPGRLIEGWNRGLLGMKEGARRLILVPAALGYGEDGYAAINVPPNAELVFEVELVRILQQPEIDLEQARKWEDGALSNELEVGNGPEFAPNGYGTFHVTWWNEDHEIAGTSLERVEPVVIRFEGISGWSSYTVGMRTGGKRVVAAKNIQEIGFGDEAKKIESNRLYLIEAVEIYAPLVQPEFEQAELIDLGNGLKYVDLEIGKGEELPKYAALEVNFTGWRADGTVFETTLSPGGQPRSVSADWDLPVWGVGTRGMKVGGRRLIFCPPQFAYLEEGSDKLRIAPNESLVFYLELRNFEMPLFLPEEAIEDEEFMKIWNEKFGDTDSLFGDFGATDVEEEDPDADR